jgi:hypothetical protein
MSNAKERAVWLLGMILCGLLVGCQETRLLSCMPRKPAVESRSYDYHDPFPDDEIGPKTYSRPRTFEEPRSDTRKSFDLRNLQASRGFPPQTQYAWDPAAPMRTAGFPVQPIWRQQPAAPVPTDPQDWDDSGPRYDVVPQ